MYYLLFCVPKRVAENVFMLFLIWRQFNYGAVKEIRLKNIEFRISVNLTKCPKHEI